jgi:tripartite-type tricarboxylate transporter receptor subunit TctC
MSPWIGVYAPANTPKSIIDKLNAEVNKALKHPDVAGSLTSQVLDPQPSTPEEFAQRIKIDFEKYGKLIRATGVKVD